MTDSSQGYSRYQHDMVRFAKKQWSRVDVVGDHVVTVQQGDHVVNVSFFCRPPTRFEHTKDWILWHLALVCT